MALGKQIRFYREKLDLTLETLSERSGVDLGTISALEMRDSSRSKYARAIAQSLGLTLDQLMDESRDWLAARATQSSAVLQLREPPVAAYIQWPFPDVAPSEYFDLSSEARSEVQGFVKALILRNKKSAAA